MILVTAHEFGHFYLARKAGVTVHEFAVGMWPKVWSFGKDKKWTEFTIRALPLWGFVRIKWEMPTDEWLTAPDSFINAWFLSKVAILLWWILMNIIAAWIIFTIWFSVWLKPIQILPQNAMKWESYSYLLPTESFLQAKWFLSGDITSAPALIVHVADEMPAEQIWLLSWDIIEKIAWTVVDNRSLPIVLQQYIGQSFTITYTRSWEEKIADLQCPPDSCVLWVSLSTKTMYEVLPIKFPFVQAMWVAWQEMREQSRLTFTGLWNIFRQLWTDKRGETVEKLSGPIWAARIWQYLLESGWWVMFLVFGGMLSMGLAIFNLLPIPALDGWRLLWVIIQRTFRLKPEKYYTVEWWINTFFFIALMALGFYIMAQDLVRAWWVKIPFIW
jgi:regulator of sigma E protease